MKLYKISLFTLFLITTLSCNQNNKYQNVVSIEWNDFKTKQSLAGSIVEFDSILMKPSQLQIYDTLLITYNYSDDKLFHIFNLKSKKKIGESVSMGQGPTEMIQPFFVNNKNEIILFDMITSTVSKYTIEEFIKNPDPEPFQKIKLDSQVMSEIGLLGDNMIGSLYQSDYPFYLFDKNGKKTNGFAAYPKSDIVYTNTEITEAFRSIITTNQKDKVAICHFWTDLIDIYNKEGQLVKRIHGPEHIFPHF